MSDLPTFQLPDNVEIDPNFFDNPYRICVRFNEPPPGYEAIDLFASLTGMEEPPEECRGGQLRPLFNSIDPETAPTDYLRMYYFDETKGQKIIDMDVCKEAIAKLMTPNPSDHSDGGPYFERVVVDPKQLNHIQLKLSPLGIPHQTHLGEGVKIAIAETIWDMGKLIQEAFNLEFDFNDPVLEKCQELLAQQNLNDFKTHAVNAYGAVIAGMAAICPKAHPFPVTIVDDACNLQWANAIKGLKKHLNAGDVLLLEGQLEPEPEKLRPLELDAAIFQAIRELVGAGIIVIEPMGNVSGDGNDNIDAWLPPVQHHSFVPDEQFTTYTSDSGAILVAASKIRGGTIKAYEGTNIGARADLNALGTSLYTLVDGRAFGQTSAAAALIAGIAVAAQSAVKADGRRPLNSLEMRYYLKQGRPYTEGIGYMPSLQYFIDEVLLKKIPFVKA